MDKSIPSQSKSTNFDFAEFQNVSDQIFKAHSNFFCLLIRFYENIFHFQDPQFPIYVALAVVFVTVFITLITWFCKKGSRRQSVLICGPCDSGKTLLFSQLLHKTKVRF